MKLNRTNAVAMFVALNFKLAGKWDADKLNAKLSKLADNVAQSDLDAIKDSGAEGSEQVLKDINAVIAASKAGEAVELVDDTAEPTPAAPAAKAKKAPAAKKDPVEEAKKGSAEGKKDAGEPAAKKAPATKKDAAERDRFGNRVGSQAATINAALAKKWQTDEEIAKATSLPVNRVRGHAKWLESQKKVEISKEKGIRLL